MMILARKRFSQNFLHDRYVIHKIVDAISPETCVHLVEIGPGRGALTFSLAARAKKLTAIEIDRDLIALLQEQLPPMVNLIEADVLTVDFRKFTSPFTIVGNLPYHITTPILFHLLTYRQMINEMFFMLQKEVVLRMAATEGNKEYGRLSVMLQYFCEIEPLFIVAPGAFTPAPEVDSMVVRLKPYSVSPYGSVKNFERFEEIVRLAFNQRRKTVKNALKSAAMHIPSDLQGMRPEMLSVQDFVDLANSVEG